MKLRTWGFYFAEAWRGVVGNGLMSFASASTVALSLVALAAIVILGANLEHMTRMLEAQVQVVGYLKPDFDRRWSDLLVQKVRAIPHVTDVRFVTKEEALDRLRSELGPDSVLLQAAEDTSNPLPDTIEVWVDKPSQIPGVVRAMRESVTSLDSVDYQQEVVSRLAALTRAVRLAGAGFIALLLLAALFIIANTIRLTVFARRREIGIMKLVGATNGFIRWPFLLEGMLLGFVGSALAAAAAWAGYRWLAAQVALGLPFMPILRPDRVLLPLSEALVAFGVALGGAGSLLSLRRFLRV
ncbi:MAG: ABC transporter permease [Clostridia bacterium]|nr:ABC transporter permease [Clostridia bacterium]